MLMLRLWGVVVTVVDDVGVVIAGGAGGDAGDGIGSRGCGVFFFLGVGKVIVVVVPVVVILVVVVDVVVVVVVGVALLLSDVVVVLVLLLLLSQWKGWRSSSGCSSGSDTSTWL